MKKIAHSHGGDCLSTTYINDSTPLRWSCAAGHEWVVKPSGIIRGQWCKKCSTTRQGRIRKGQSIKHNKHSIEELQRIAQSRGGICLSPEYLGVNKKHLWRCANGHEWLAMPLSIIHMNSWCRICGDAKRGKASRDTITNMQQIAAQRGGMCLSTEYIGTDKSLIWQCSKGHKWKATPASIKNGTWCRICSGFNIYSIDDHCCPVKTGK